MAKINSTASDKQADAMTTTNNLLSNITITTNPVVITACQRKANIGNYETIDLYMAVALPQSTLDGLDQQALEEAIHKAAEQGFSIVGMATGDRYLALKESLKANR